MRTKVFGWTGALLLLALPAFSQSNPTGTISGKVTDQQGLAVAAVAVSAQSPALQGTRTATTSANGDYIFPLLPPGEYALEFTHTGFATVKRTVRVAPSASVPLDTTLPVSQVSETVTVEGAPIGEFGQTAEAATNFRKDFMERLPVARNFQQAALMTPGVQDSGPSGAMTISGAASFENLYMVNGVVVQDNLRNTPLNLFIEDALQETTTNTSAISAEYGRFSGGVVSAITKSGGNELSGSFRTTFDNDKWIALTPYPNDSRLDKIIPTYEITLGGPVLKDRLWFFGATRMRKFSESRNTSFTNLPFTRELDEKRYEGKLTWSLNPNHSLKTAYTHIASVENGATYGTIMDLASVYNREMPQDLLSVTYTGIITPRFFVEGHYALRKYTYIGSGSQYTDLVKGTLLLDRSRASARYNSPTFCGVCSDETRDNNNIVLKASYFLSTKSLGSHNFVVGGDIFDDKRLANNHQSGSDYRIYTTAALIRGDQVYPVIDSRTYIRWTPIFEDSLGNNFRTLSLFLNDTWTLNSRWRFNLGLRYDKNDGEDAVGTAVVKDSALSPRLSVTFDPKANDKLTVTASYAKYVSAINGGIGDVSAGGNPATIDFDYLGPAVNTGDPANPATTAEVLTTLFNWFNANGGTSRATRGAPGIPGLTNRIDSRLASPSVQELTLGFSQRLGNRGLVRVDGVYRTFGDFYGNLLDRTTGTVSDKYGQLYDLSYTVNTDRVERTYKALNLQVSYRVHDRVDVGGNYTLGETSGNFNGETGPNGPVTTAVLSNQEYFDPSWGGGPNTGGYLPAGSSGGPVGDLLSDVRHRARAWVVWSAPIPKAVGQASLSWLQIFRTGSPYGAVGVIDTRPYVTNPGYVDPPSSVEYYFTARDAYRMATLHETDLAFNYSKRVGVKNAEVFLRAMVVNVFNRQEVTNWAGGAYPGSGQAGCGTSGCINAGVQTNNSVTTLAAFNPFTETPVEGVHWRKSATFGQPVSRFAYQTPRTLNFSVGVRF
jgi:hypothetical protein